MEQPLKTENMSGIQRFLSKRDKIIKIKDTGLAELKAVNIKNAIEAPSLSPSWKLFSLEKPGCNYDNPRLDAIEKLIPELKQRITKLGIPGLKDDNIRYVLNSKYANGNANKALEFIFLIKDSMEGILREYHPGTKLLGAENRGGVSCYLDALLFSMFSRLDCFENILYNTFSDKPRRDLVVILRLWVNMLRTGNLIPKSITKQLQDALAACGWEDATMPRQQDASEAFTFITEILELPLLTLKMDIYHAGKGEVGDDHKFVNERLLEVAIPSGLDKNTPVTLEDCLELYFNSRIEVKRYLERHTTLNSISSTDSLSKGDAKHIETVEINTTPSSPSAGASSLLNSPPSSVKKTSTFADSPSGRSRAKSIVRERFISEDEDNPVLSKRANPGRPENRSRKGSIRKEVMMPAWQIFSLIPWYTDNRPTSDRETAIHFSEKRPILGICLKRYSVADGKTIRLETYVDIPVEIGLPHFIKDDLLEDDGPLYGNFKLALQAVICHRGSSVDSGHYISLVRATKDANQPRVSSNGPGNRNRPLDNNDYWMRFDDLARERITLVNIEQALKDESPYLLFYQILPVEADPGELCMPSHRESDNLKSNFLEKEFAGMWDTSSDEEPYFEGIGRSSQRPLAESTNRARLRSYIPARRDSDSQHRPTAQTDKPRARPESMVMERKIGATLARFSRRKSADTLVKAEDQNETGYKNGEGRRSKDKPRSAEKGKSPVSPKKGPKAPDRECVVM